MKRIDESRRIIDQAIAQVGREIDPRGMQEVCNMCSLIISVVIGPLVKHVGRDQALLLLHGYAELIRNDPENQTKPGDPTQSQHQPAPGVH